MGDFDGWYEVVLLIVLGLITFYRKELSCNADMRDELEEEKRKFSEEKEAARKKAEKQAILAAERKPSGELFLNLLSSADNLFNITKYLDTRELTLFSAVNTHLRKLGSSNELWEHIWMEHYADTWCNDFVVRLRRNRGISWDPRKDPAPIQGWKKFMLDFEYGWLDWILAGHNTPQLCALAIHGCIYDVTKFVSSHPGSPETLLDHAGMDATDIFEDIGHSR
jgi:hypothetical protein